MNRRYSKGVPFLSKMVSKCVRSWTTGKASPYKTLFSTLLESSMNIDIIEIDLFTQMPPRENVAITFTELTRLC